MKVVNITAKQRAAINRQVQRVCKADAAETVGTWRFADELVTLATVYKAAYHKPPSTKTLDQLVHITRDGSRMQRLIKVASFFPASTRVAGAGMRIYEKAFDVNQSLKCEGRPQFTAEAIADLIRSRSISNADIMKDYMGFRDDPEDARIQFEQRNALRKLAMTKSEWRRISKKKWLKLIEKDAHLAAAAVIANNEDSWFITQVNQALNNLGSGYHISSNHQYVQQDLFEDEFTDEANTEAA